MVAPPALQNAFQTVQQMCASDRRLRPHALRMYNDMLAVAAGLRPAAMVDYAPVAPDLLAGIVASFAAALGLVLSRTSDPGVLCPEPQGTAGWLVAVLSDCCYVVRPGLLASLVGQGEAACGSRPLLITFQPAGRVVGSGASPAWASPDEAATVWQQASRLVALLLEGLEGQPASNSGTGDKKSRSSGSAAAQPDGSCLSSVNRSMGCSAAPLAAAEAALRKRGTQVPIVVLDDIPGIPVMPTLSGLLLGYPAVYVVQDLPAAQAASRCLSSSSLCFYSAALLSDQGTCIPGTETLGVAGRKHNASEEVQLLGFSVPQELASDPHWDSHRVIFLAELRSRVDAAGARGFPWVNAGLHAHLSMPRPVAL